MKICHIISAFDRYDTRIFWKQCRSLVHEGHEVILITNDGEKDEDYEGVKILCSGFDNKNRITRILFSRTKSFKKALEVNADIYQIHDPEFLPIGLRLLKKRKKVVYDSHEDFPRQILEKEWIPFIFRKIISFVADIYIDYAYKKFNAVLSVTPHIVDIIKKSTEKVFLITNYPIIEKFSENFTFEEYKSKANILCYSGTVYRNSMQENILEAINSIEGMKYLIVGSLEESFHEKLSHFKAWEKVEYIKRVPKEKLLKIYSSVSIGIVIFAYSPNMGGKMGTLGNNKIFEYMHHGLPIICTDFILWKEIIDKYNCGIYVNPNNIDEINAAINFLINNKKKAYEMGQNGKKAVDVEFNWNSQRTLYLKVINDVYNNKLK